MHVQRPHHCGPGAGADAAAFIGIELKGTTNVAIFNVNARPELHGEERVSAVDVGIRLDGENTLLDLMEQGVREHHFCNSAAGARQETPRKNWSA
jgi:hypothetical protein